MKQGDNYQAWSIDEKDFPKDGLLEDKIRFFVGYGVLAPSTFNAQPWLCQINDNKLQVFLDLNRMPKKSDKSGRFGYISIGCFLETILIAAKYFGFRSNVKIHDSDPIKESELEVVCVAQVEFYPDSKKNDEEDLFHAIKKRATNRSESLDKKIPDEVINRLNSFIGKSEKICVLGSDQKNRLLSISNNADLQIWGDVEFRKEHVQWVRNNLTTQYDGMPAFGVGIKLIPSFFARPVILSPFFAKFQAKKNIKALLSTHNFIVLLGKEENSNWIEIGMSFLKISLYLTTKGIVCSPMGQFVEDDSAREELHSLLPSKKDDLRPQLFFRIGFPSQPVKRSPRKPVERILLGNNSFNEFEKKLAKTIGTKLEKHRIELDKYSISYITAGSGKPLILIHGLNMGWGQWHPNIVELSKHFKIYALDLPGSGESTFVQFRNIYLQNDYIDTLIEFIRKNELKEVNILGHSTGGLIALKLGLQNEKLIHKIVASDPLGLTSHMPFQFKPLAFYPIALFLSKTAMKPTKGNVSKFLQSALHQKTKLSQEFTEYYHHYISTNKTNHPFLLINRIAGFLRINNEFLILDQIKKISVPTLIIMGEKDPLIPIEKVKKLIGQPSHIQFEVIKDVGHVPSFEETEKFNKLVIQFLQE